MPRLKPGEVYKRGPHAGMTKGSGKKQPKTWAEEMAEKKHSGPPKYLEKEPRKGKVLSTSKHHPFDEPNEYYKEMKAKKHTKEDLSKANAHMKKHGG